MLLDNFSDKYNFIVTFANTGAEHEKTLEFIKNCDEYFNFNTIWLEADVVKEKGKGTGFKIVDFYTASRNFEPFEDVVSKYGIPNPAYPHCTRELKLAPMRSYLKSLGINHKEIKTAIGIRMDETRRVSKTQQEMNIEYPLISLFPSDKEDVLDWWKGQPFDLEIEEWDGNCKGCYKKSFKKIFKQLDNDPTFFDFYLRMEKEYPFTGNTSNTVTNYYLDEHGERLCDDNGNPLVYHTQRPPRVFFRGNTSSENLLKLYREDRLSNNQSSLFTLDGGCSESCEVYGTEG